MMADVTTPAKARSYAIQAGLALVLAVVFANVTFNLFGFKVSFVFAPFIVLFLWPNGADQNISYLAIFLSSLLLDMLSGAPLGGWAVIYLPVFAILTQFSGRSETGFGETFARFLLAIVAFSCFFLFVGLMGVQDLNYFSILKMIMVCVLLFPVIYASKSKLRMVLVGEDG